MNIGFSTGSLTKGDYKLAISLLKRAKISTIELSSLRESEFQGLINDLDELDLKEFKYISFHAPSKLECLSEEECVNLLMKVVERKYHIIVHPDIITNYSLWMPLGKYLCIENMDKRKPIGQTVKDLEMIFKELPEASFCFDLAHVRQIDSTMLEGIDMAKRFSSRLVQLHLSDVNSDSKHESLNFEAIKSFQKISKYINSKIPCILESPVTAIKLKSEVKLASYIFDKTKFSKKESAMEYHSATLF